MTTIYVLNGPNLNLLGTRQPETYGHATLADVEALCRESAAAHGLSVEFRQSNHEGEIIEAIHEAGRSKAAGIIINPAGYSHTSIALLDAVLGVALPTVEVHISNIHARESFRHRSYVSRGAKAVICGFGIEGYRLAIQGLAKIVGAHAGKAGADG
jgi:3-dehydroquinate dehydratase-2